MDPELQRLVAMAWEQHGAAVREPWLVQPSAPILVPEGNAGVAKAALSSPSPSGGRSKRPLRRRAAGSPLRSTADEWTPRAVAEFVGVVGEAGLSPGNIHPPTT